MRQVFLKNRDIIAQVVKKKEFSKIKREDILVAFSHFEKKNISYVDKIKRTRDLLRKVFSVFSSNKLLKNRNLENLKEPNWYLKKHLSTRERLPYYKQLYRRTLQDFGNKKINIFDFGCGVNGFSYPFFKKIGLNINYIGIESVGQLVDLVNAYLRNNKLRGIVFHESLFNTDKLKEIIRTQSRPRVLFLLKVVDSLEMLRRDYSKKLLLELGRFFDRIIVSFATKSLVSRKNFRANRAWFEAFAGKHFQIKDKFMFGDEIYFVLENLK